MKKLTREWKIKKHNPQSTKARQFISGSSICETNGPLLISPVVSKNTVSLRKGQQSDIQRGSDTHLRRSQRLQEKDPNKSFKDKKSDQDACSIRNESFKDEIDTEFASSRSKSKETKMVKTVRANTCHSFSHCSPDFDTDTSLVSKKHTQATDSSLIDENTSAAKQNQNNENFCDLASWNLPEPVVLAYLSNNITNMFPWQAECLSMKSVLNGNNLVFSAPTSAGKTLVAEILMLKKVLETKKKAIMILPFVSVVREKVYHLQEMFQNAGLVTGGYMGAHHPPGGFTAVDIAICTIEKANNLVNRLIESKRLEELGVLVIDELHMLGDHSRGYLLELLLTKLLYSCRKNNIDIQIVGMSATLPNLNVLARWLSSELYHTDFRPVPLHEMFTIGDILYDSKTNMPIRNLKNTAVSFQNDSDHAIYLAVETIAAGHGVLVFCPTKNWCEKLATNLAHEIFNIGKYGNESHKTPAYKAICGKLREHINGAALNSVLQQLKSSPAGLDKVLSLTVPFGVAFHHAGLTFDERDIIEGAFRQGILKVLVATTTLSSGVNLPARRVIIRSPLFGGKIIDTLSYKQMVGRAGRKGIDEKGESILLCKNTEKNLALSIVTSHLPPVKSCLLMPGSNSVHSSMKRALIEVISSGIAETHEEVLQYASCTLLSACLVEDNSTEISLNDIECAVNKCLNDLIENEFIFKQEETANDTNIIGYKPSQLGLAVLASGFSPDDALRVMRELQLARRCFVLENDLHILYEVTPPYLSDQIGSINWFHFLSLWEQLPKEYKRVGELVGVKESFIGLGIQGKINRDAHMLAIHQRFYAALALNDLIQEVPLSVVSAKYDCTRGILQSLQQTTSTFAGMLTVFCNRLGWFTLELIFSHFQRRLHFGIQQELCNLVQLSSLNAQTARILYDGGYETISLLASAHPNNIAVLLCNAGSFESVKQLGGCLDEDAVHRNEAKRIRITGKYGVSEKEISNMIIEEAQYFIKQELGVKNISWESQQNMNLNKKSSELHSISNQLDISLNTIPPVTDDKTSVKQYQQNTPIQKEFPKSSEVILSASDNNEVNHFQNSDENLQIRRSVLNCQPIMNSEDNIKGRRTENESVNLSTTFRDKNEIFQPEKNAVKIIERCIISNQDLENSVFRSTDDLNKSNDNVSANEKVNLENIDILCSPKIEISNLETFCETKDNFDSIMMQNVYDKLFDLSQQNDLTQLPIHEGNTKNTLNDPTVEDDSSFSELLLSQTAETDFVYHSETFVDENLNISLCRSSNLVMQDEKNAAYVDKQQNSVWEYSDTSPSILDMCDEKNVKKSSLTESQMNFICDGSYLNSQNHSESNINLNSNNKASSTNSPKISPKDLHYSSENSFIEEIKTKSCYNKSVSDSERECLAEMSDDIFESGESFDLSKPNTVKKNISDCSFKEAPDSFIKQVADGSSDIFDDDLLFNDIPGTPNKETGDKCYVNDSKKDDTFNANGSSVKSPLLVGVKSLNVKVADTTSELNSNIKKESNFIQKDNALLLGKEIFPESYLCKETSDLLSDTEENYVVNSQLFKSWDSSRTDSPNSPAEIGKGKHISPSQVKNSFKFTENDLTENKADNVNEDEINENLLFNNADNFSSSFSSECLSPSPPQKTSLVKNDENYELKTPISLHLSHLTIQNFMKDITENTISDALINDNNKSYNDEFIASEVLQNVESSSFVNSPSIKILDIFESKINVFKKMVNKTQKLAFSFALEKTSHRKSTIGPPKMKDKDDVTPDNNFCVREPDVQIIGFAVCWGQPSFYVPIPGVAELSNAGFSSKSNKQAEELRKLFSCSLFKKSVIAYDIKAQYKMLLQKWNLTMQADQDTKFLDPSVAAWLLDPGLGKQSLNELVKNYLPDAVGLLEGFREIKGSFGLQHWNSLPGRQRASIEAYLSFHLMNKLEDVLKDRNLYETFIGVEMPAIFALSKMEYIGLGFDSKLALMCLKELKQKQNAVLQSAYQAAGRKFNIMSSIEVSRILFKELKLNSDQIQGSPVAQKFLSVGITTRSSSKKLPRELKTNKACLEKILHLHPLPKAILDFRKLSFSLQQVLMPLLRENKYDQYFNMHRLYSKCFVYTATGRIQMHSPNLQFVPRNFSVNETVPEVNYLDDDASQDEGQFTPEDIAQYSISLRNLFIPSKGNIFLSADYSQLELRVLAHLSDDANLLESLNSGEDVFKQIAAKWKKIPSTSVTEDLRQQAKKICYGMVYGMSVKALSHQLKTGEDYAFMFLESFKNSYPGLTNYLKIIVEKCQKDGYVTTLNHRRRYLPLIRSKIKNERAHAERQAINTTIQGSAADIIKAAMVQIENDLHNVFSRASTPCSLSTKDSICNIDRKPFVGACLVLQLHDELIYEVNKKDVEKVVQIVKNAMEETTKLSVKLPVKIHLGLSWGCMKEISDYSEFLS